MHTQNRKGQGTTMISLSHTAEIREEKAFLGIPVNNFKQLNVYTLHENSKNINKKIK